MRLFIITLTVSAVSFFSVIVADGVSAAESDPQVITTAQDVYGLEPGAKAKINADGAAGLDYSVADPSIARVNQNGEVTALGTGTTTVTIKSSDMVGHTTAEKTVTVRVAGYKKPTGRIIHSKYDADKKPGDKSGRESVVAKYRYQKNNPAYSYSFIVRCNDPYVADCAATAAGYIVKNPHFGYDALKPKSQKKVDKRASIYVAVRNEVGKNPTKEQLKKIKGIKKYADTSCTPTLLTGYWLYYDMDTKLNMKWIKGYTKKAYKYYCGSVNVEAHQLEKAVKRVNAEYTAAGKQAPFKIIYIKKDKRKSFFAPKNMKKNLRRGDILCSNPKVMGPGHTVMVQ